MRVSDKKMIIDPEMKKELIKNTHYGKKKDRPYQSIGDMKGRRDMSYRYKLMQLPEIFENKSVLDIGCNMGMVCMEAKMRGAVRAVGIDIHNKFIRQARKFFKANNCDVRFVRFDMNDGVDKLIEKIGSEKFDYVFALAVWHSATGKNLWDIINYYCKEICWFEGHAKQTHKMILSKLSDNLVFSRFDFLGYGENNRANFRLEK